MYVSPTTVTSIAGLKRKHWRWQSLGVLRSTTLGFFFPWHIWWLLPNGPVTFNMGDPSVSFFSKANKVPWLSHTRTQWVWSHTQKWLLRCSRHSQKLMNVTHVRFNNSCREHSKFMLFFLSLRTKKPPRQMGLKRRRRNTFCVFCTRTSSDSLLASLTSSHSYQFNRGVEVTIIWLFVTVTAGLRPSANIRKSIHWQFNYTVSTEKVKRNIRFPFRRSVDWTAILGEFDSAVARNMWEQFAGSVTEQNIGRIHFGGACQLPVNVKLMIPLLNLLRMPCGSPRCDTPY